MSLTPVPTGEPVSTAIGTALATAASTFLPKLFGGKGGPNIAKSLSKQVGFTVQQSDAAAVRARLASGLDPRTGVATQPGLTQRLGGVGNIFRNFVTGAAGAAISRLPTILQPTASVAAGLTSAEIDKIINRPASGTPPPLTLPNPVNLPTVSRKVLSTPAIPRRQMVPPGGGRVSLLPAAGMASVGAIARMGGRGLIRTTTGRISRIMLPSGQTFSRKNAASLIRRVGFEAAAVALGISVVEAAELLLADSQTRRRGKGITAAALRNAKATTCRVRTAARVLGIKSTAAPRRRTCRS